MDISLPLKAYLTSLPATLMTFGFSGYFYHKSEHNTKHYEFFPLIIKVILTSCNLGNLLTGCRISWFWGLIAGQTITCIIRFYFDISDIFNFTREDEWQIHIYGAAIYMFVYQVIIRRLISVVDVKPLVIGAFLRRN